jgi:hypothetical protein
MTSIRAVHRFLPVGQGLFVTGSVEFWPPPPRRRRNIDLGGRSGPPPLGPYRWVYDCGSSTNKRLVTNGIESVKADCAGHRLDLLTLSHFHNDHINGVVELLNKVGTKTIMLPWAPLWHRLVIGFEQGLQADDAEMLFYVDPVAYLSQEAGDGFERVLFVMPSDGEGPPFLTDPTFPPPRTEGPDDREKDDGPGEGAFPHELDVSGRGATWRVRQLRPGGSIAVYGVWEFVPYNDPSTRPDDPLGFAAVVDTHRSVLLNGSPDERKGALRKLRSHYEATFGRTAMNDVSLMLYGGAVGSWRGQRFCDCDCLLHRVLDSCGCWKEHETKGAILMTGDGNLSSELKWASLERYLSAKRAKRTCVFQVAHHGARANWHEGLAALAAPVISVFSSDPRHSYGHPHAEVLRDFWPFRPVQVDQHGGFATSVFLEQ